MVKYLNTVWQGLHSVPFGEYGVGSRNASLLPRGMPMQWGKGRGALL